MRHAKAAAHVTHHCKTTRVHFEVEGPTNLLALSRRAEEQVSEAETLILGGAGRRAGGSLSSAKPNVVL